MLKFFKKLKEFFFGKKRDEPDRTDELSDTGNNDFDSDAIVDMGGKAYGHGFEIKNQKNIVLKNLVIQGLRGDYVGIYILDSHNITIENVTFLDCHSRGNAHGVLVHGKSKKGSTNIKILKCSFVNMTLGHSEAAVVNGNVDGFEIAHCTFKDLDNIPCDAIGYEGVCDDVNLDFARNGHIHDNVISFCKGKDKICAGIYVDGGRDILIENNQVTDGQMGIEIAPEHKGKWSQNIKVINNYITRNSYCGISYGGGEKYNGGVRDCQFINNTLLNHNSKNGNFWKQHNTERIVTEPNILE